MKETIKEMADKILEQVRDNLANEIYNSLSMNIYEEAKKIADRVIIDQINVHLDMFTNNHVFEVNIKWKHLIENMEVRFNGDK